MKVKDLIDRLKKFNPDTEVIMANDHEGQWVEEIDDIRTGFYDEDEGFSEEDTAPGDRAVCLWPPKEL